MEAVTRMSVVSATHPCCICGRRIVIRSAVAEKGPASVPHGSTVAQSSPLLWSLLSSPTASACKYGLIMSRRLGAATPLVKKGYHLGILLLSDMLVRADVKPAIQLAKHALVVVLALVTLGQVLGDRLD